MQSSEIVGVAGVRERFGGRDSPSPGNNALAMYAVLQRGLPKNTLYSGALPGSMFCLNKFPVGGQGVRAGRFRRQGGQGHAHHGV